jgi:hypothetical protein
MIRALTASVGLLAAGVLTLGVGVAAARPQSQDQTSSSSSASAASSNGSSSTAAKPKPKKVWTNEDMGDVTGTISVVGTVQQKPATIPSKISSLVPAVPSAGNSKQATAAKNGDDSVDPKLLAQLRQQLQKLQASIDQLDKQIEQLKGASRGDSKNLGILTSDPSSYSMEPVPDQIKALEAKKATLQASMDQLLDAARLSGIEPGQLR